MKAIIKKEARPGLELVDNISMPEVGPNDVLIKVKKTAICGTDLHIYKWDAWAQKTVNAPLVIGHEFMGEVVEVGSQVTCAKMGERVSAEGHLVCGECKHCREERRHLCPNTKGIGYDCQGAFAEYAVIPESNIWKPAEEISDEELACFDPFGNTVHTAMAFDLVGKDVLITGAGPIGCMASAIAKHAGARNVVVMDINDYRLNLAKEMGATVAVNDKTMNLKEVMKELGIHDCFEIGMEMSGASVAFNKMIDVMMNGGQIGLLGILPDGASVEWTKVVFKSLTLKGIYGRKIFDTWYRSTAMLQSGLDIKPVITHQLDYTEFQKGFDLMESGQCGKVILNWA